MSIVIWSLLLRLELCQLQGARVRRSKGIVYILVLTKTSYLAIPGAPKRSQIWDLVPFGPKKVPILLPSPKFLILPSDDAEKGRHIAVSHCCALFGHLQCIMCMSLILNGPLIWYWPFDIFWNRKCCDNTFLPVFFFHFHENNDKVPESSKMVPKKSQFCLKGLNFAFVRIFWVKSQILECLSKQLKGFQGGVQLEALNSSLLILRCSEYVQLYTWAKSYISTGGNTVSNTEGNTLARFNLHLRRPILPWNIVSATSGSP